MKNDSEHQAIEPDHSERVIELFEQARELPPEQREAYLAEACGGDEELRRELESLLEHADPALPTSAIKLAARQLAENERQDWTGRQINQYRLLGVLGEGGMGKVYLAEDEKLGRRVAIKFLPETFLANTNQVLRFEQEARAASALNHPNIITIHEIGQHEGAPYIAYELVEGQTLRQRLRGCALDWQEAVGIGAQIAAALKAAHSAGIIHRDIKPENVMLRADGLVKVLDFGIAKRFDLSAAEAKTCVAITAANATQEGQILGTIGYLSPEQARGEEIDKHTDIFSLGVVIYEMLAVHPYADLTLQEKLEAVTGAEELPPIGERSIELPAALDAIVTKAARKSRDKRYSSVDEMVDALNELRLPTKMGTDLKARKLLAKERANKLLNQSVALYASDPTTRLSLADWWTILRWSRLPCGRLERALLRKSIVSVLLKTLITALAAGLVAFAVAAWLSITERFTAEQFLHDGHDRAVRQFAISPDGKKLVSVGNDAKIIVWDFATRARLATLTQNGDNAVASVAFAPDGHLFATSCADETVAVWDAESYTKETMLPGHKGGANRISFSPNGRWLLTANGANRRTIWEVGSWRKVRELFSPGLGGTEVPVFSPDSRFLLDQSWRIWDTEKGVALTSEQPLGWYWNALSPDGKQFVTAETSGSISFWDFGHFWPSGQRHLIKGEQVHRERARAAAYSPDGRYVATGGETIILWDAQTQTKLARFPYPERISYLDFTPDSKSLIACYGDAQLLIWDIEAREQKASFVGHSHPVRTVTYAPDGKTIASAGDDQSIILWDNVSRRKKTVLSAHRTRVSALEFSPDGQQLISTDLHGETIVWEVSTGRERLRFTMPGLSNQRFGYAVSLSPNQQWIATSFGVHSSTDGRVVADFDNKNKSGVPGISEFYGVKFSPDGRWLAGVNPANQVFLWDTADWTLRQRAEANQGRTTGLISLAFSPDSRWFVTGEDQGNLRLWQVEPLREVALLGQHKSYIRSVAFSHDGRFVASASDDKTLRVWDVARRKEVEQVGIHTSPVLAVSFSPDDKQLVSGENDNSVRVYTRRRSLWGWSLD